MMNSTVRTRPPMMAHIAIFFALAAAACAPLRSPCAHSVLTLLASRIAKIAAGQQQKIDAIARPRLLFGGASVAAVIEPCGAW